MTSITQKLPPELLIKILNNATVLDVLRLKQVDRIFRDIIHASPLLQHKIDLFAVGLEYNAAAAGISIADSRKALLQYRSNLDSFRPIKERMVEILRQETPRTANGVCAIIEDSLRLFVPGSISRGIPYKEWEIPLPGPTKRTYDFCPNADVVAFAEVTEVATYPRIGIYLRTLSDGSHHPVARCPTIYYSRGSARSYIISSISITSSRLMVFARMGKHYLIIWDWKSGDVLFELEGDHYIIVEFIDDRRLLATLNPALGNPPSFVLMDTGKDINGAPPQALLRFSRYFSESVAPFHQDPSQRIVVFDFSYTPCYFILKVESLLELLESHEGSEIEWDEWKSHVVIPIRNLGRVVLSWVSGCRLFLVRSADSDPLAREMDVYDFSMQGRAKYLIQLDLGPEAGARCLSPTGAKAWIPWDAMRDARCGHDGIIFCDLPNGAAGDGPCVLHIWTIL